MIRSIRFRRICRLIAGLLVAAALIRLALSFVPLFDPLLAWPVTGCESCTFQRDPVTLLATDEAKRGAWQTPGTERRILEHLEQPEVRILLFAAEAVRAVPLFILFLTLGLALRAFAAGGFSLAAVRWLRWSALTSIAWVLAQPVAQSIRWTTFSEITHGRDFTHLVLNLNDLLWPMLLSFAVWIAAWALEEATTLQQDLEEFV